MGTGYRIDLGYMSGDSFDGTNEEAWDALVEVVTSIRTNTERILTEARRSSSVFKRCEECESCGWEAYAEAYKKNEDATLRIVEEPWFPLPEGEEFKPYIHMMATGCRGLKEHFRRTFCRLVIEEMHKRGIEVNLNVG